MGKNSLRKAQRKLEREQQRIAEQQRQREILNPKQNIGMYLHSPWCFDKWFEKLILIALTFLGMWKLGGLIF